MMVMTDNRSRSGFTLLELLIALTVLGFLFVRLAQGVHFGLLAWAAEAHLTSGNDDFNTLDSTLRHLIEVIDPGDDIDLAPFSANEAKLDCITALPSAFGATPGRRIHATLLVDGDHRLVLRWQPSARAMSLRPPSPPTETGLLRGVSRIELAFWQAGGGWRSTWRSPELPTMVRVRLHPPAGDPRQWPDIVAAPVLNRP